MSHAQLRVSEMGYCESMAGQRMKQVSLHQRRFKEVSLLTQIFISDTEIVLFLWSLLDFSLAFQMF